MFYIAMLDEIPDPSSYSEDAAEVVKGQWLNPVEALEQHYSGEKANWNKLVYTK